MNTRKALGMLCGAAIAAAMMVPTARADNLMESRQFEQLTFNQPVDIPGQQLPAGTYWFVLPDSSFNLNTIQVLNADRTQCLATINTIGSYRYGVTDTTALTFAEEPDQQSLVLVKWFYPGMREGHEFTYPREEERALSEQPSITVRARRGEILTAQAGSAKVTLAANW